MYYSKDIEREREKGRIYRSQNKEKTRIARARWRAKNPGYKRPRFLKYGLSEGDYADLLAAQGGLCAVCKERPDSGLCVDHSHVTGKVRGLLCLTCNAGIGMLKDSESLLSSAIEYLKQAS